MKTHLFSFAFGLAMLMAACQKDDTLMLDESSRTFAPPASERYGCLPPTTFDVQNITNVSAKILWDAMPEAIGYRVEVSSGGFNAEEDEFTSTYLLEATENSQITLTGLSPRTAYKYRVTTVCGNEESVVSETMYFTTKNLVYGDPAYHFPKVYKLGHADAQ